VPDNVLAREYIELTATGDLDAKLAAVRKELEAADKSLTGAASGFRLICWSGGPSAARCQAARFRRIVAAAWQALTPAMRRTLRTCPLYLGDWPGMRAHYWTRPRFIAVSAYALARMSDVAAETVLVHELMHAWAHARRLPCYRDENAIDRLTEGRGLPMREVRAFVMGLGPDPGRPAGFWRPDLVS